MDSQSVILTPEDKLLRRCADAGSQAAFTELVERYYDFVYSVCRRKLGDEQLAQDTSQAVFLLLAANAARLKSGAALTSWLFKTAHFACRNAQRTEMRRRRYEEQAARQMSLDQILSNREPLWREIEPLLDDALAHLSERDREVVLLRYVDTLSLAEIASALGITLTTAHKRITRALEKMRRHIGAATNGASFAALLDENLVQAAPAGALRQASLMLAPGGAAAGSAAAHAGYQAVLKEMTLVKVKLVLTVAISLCVIAAAGDLLPKVLHRPPVAVAAHAPLPRLASAFYPGKTTLLAGRVVDEAGRPVAGASVTIVRYYGHYDLPPVEAEPVTTDSGGLYTARIAMQAQDACIAFADSGERFGWGVPGHDTRLPKAAATQVYVVDESDKPVVGVAVEPMQFAWGAGGRIFAMQPGPTCPKRLIVTTNVGGMALVHGLPAGYAVGWQIEDPTYAVAGEDPVPANTARIAGDAPGVTIRVVRAGAIQGTVMTDDGRTAPAGLRVGAQLLGKMQSVSAYTDENGRYVIAHAPSGVYNVAVDTGSPILGGEWSSVALPSVAVEAGRALTYRNIMLTRGVFISGRVTHGATGKPDVGAQIGIYGPAHPQSSPWVQDTVTDAAGAFTARVPPGKQYVYIMTDADASNGQNVTTGTASAAAIHLEASR